MLCPNCIGWQHVTPGGDASRDWIGPCEHLETLGDAAENASKSRSVAWGLAYVDKRNENGQIDSGVNPWPFLLQGDITDDPHVLHEPSISDAAEMWNIEADMSW